MNRVRPPSREAGAMRDGIGPGPSATDYLTVFDALVLLAVL